MNPPLVLASASPRRAEILRALGLAFEVTASKVDEAALTIVHTDRAAGDIAATLARAKADASLLVAGSLVIAADTVVTIDGELLGKPADEASARNMLQLLSGRTHKVITAVEMIAEGTALSGRVSAEVTMRDLSNETIQEYVETGEPFDKAGAYAVQGRSSSLVETVDGCYLTVVGLPVCLVLMLLAELAPAVAMSLDHIARPGAIESCERIAGVIAGISALPPPCHPRRLPLIESRAQDGHEIARRIDDR